MHVQTAPRVPCKKHGATKRVKVGIILVFKNTCLLADSLGQKINGQSCITFFADNLKNKKTFKHEYKQAINIEIHSKSQIELNLTSFYELLKMKVDKA